ncbi:SOS response-associated peptidase [Tamlana flava]|uniref:SOS response-associated peptidase n=1 Tax=Tamlana flava TaxID=3158572 RepID=UPI00351B65B0
MCYSTALRKEEEEIRREMRRKGMVVNFGVGLEYTPYYHLNGFSRGNLYIIKMDEPESIYPATWGLVPDYALDRPDDFWKKANTLNARGENIFETMSFRGSADDKRCLILADGFYEPHHENGVAQPYFCYQPTDEYKEGGLFLFAGLYNGLDTDFYTKLYTTTILTVEANPFFSEIHNKKKRMPLVLDSNYYEDWLDSGLSRQSVGEIIATGFTEMEFKAHPVSRDLYKKGIDTNRPYIVEPVQKDTLF